MQNFAGISQIPQPVRGSDQKEVLSNKKKSNVTKHKKLTRIKDD